MRRAFTLLELLVVVAIIAILATMVMVAATGSIRAGRAKRATAMATALEQGIAAYYAQEGEWPNTIEQKVSNMDGDTYTFDKNETAKILRDVVGHAWGKSGSVRSMLVDASALFVAEDGHTYGVDFSEAAKRNGKHYIPFQQMVFGYADANTGHFRRFSITYDVRSDSVIVRTKTGDGS